jgi:hypothetical protein
MNASMNSEAVATNALENIQDEAQNAQGAVANMAENTTTNK